MEYLLAKKIVTFVKTSSIMKNTYLRSSFVYCSVFVLFSFTFFSCKESLNVKDIKIVALNGPSALSMLQLLDSSMTTHWHIDIYKEPEQVRQLMLQNKTDWAILPYNVAVMMFNKGSNYKLAAVPVWGSLYLSGSDTLTTWEELKGKKVFLMARGMTPDLIFRELLKRNKLKVDTDVFLDYSFPTHIDLALAAATGKAPIALLSEPMLSVAMEQNSNMKILLDMQKEWIKYIGNEAPMAQTALVVNAEYAAKNAEEVKLFLSAYQESLNWVKLNSDLAAKRAVDRKIVSSYQAALVALSRCHFEWMYADEGKAKLEQYTQLLLNQNPAVVGGKLPADSFYLVHQ